MQSASCSRLGAWAAWSSSVAGSVSGCHNRSHGAHANLDPILVGMGRPNGRQGGVQSPNSGDFRGSPPEGPDEFAVIERLRERFELAARARFPVGPLPPTGDTWIGDDAAVVAV